MRKKGLKKAAIAAVALSLTLSVFAIAGCANQPAPKGDATDTAPKTEQPAAAAAEPEADKADDMAANTAAVSFAMPVDFHNNDAGSLTETD